MTSHAIDDVRTQVKLAIAKQDLEEKQVRSVKHVKGGLNYSDAFTKKPTFKVRERLQQAMMTGTIDRIL